MNYAGNKLGVDFTPSQNHTILNAFELNQYSSLQFTTCTNIAFNTLAIYSKNNKDQNTHLSKVMH